MSELTITTNAESFIARFAGASDRLHDRMRGAVQRLAIEIQASVKDSKLSGQVLHVRTGTLRRSINQRVDEDAGNITGVVGTNVRYAAIHEYGGNRLITQAWGHPLKYPVWQTFPERSFLRSTLAENTARIGEKLRETALAAVRPQ